MTWSQSLRERVGWQQDHLPVELSKSEGSREDETKTGSGGRTVRLSEPCIELEVAARCPLAVAPPLGTYIRPGSLRGLKVSRTAQAAMARYRHPAKLRPASAGSWHAGPVLQAARSKKQIATRYSLERLGVGLHDPTGHFGRAQPPVDSPSATHSLRIFARPMHDASTLACFWFCENRQSLGLSHSVEKATY